MASPRAARTRVLSNPGQWREGDNPFLKLLLESYGDSVEVVAFSWRRALGRRYDVLHIHWLEYLVRSDTAPRRALKRCLFALLLARLTLGRTPSVWTVHNESPHEATSSRFEGWLLRRWPRAVSHRVFLTRAAWSAAGRPHRSSVIVHGHYRPVLFHPPQPPRPGPAGTILHFGHIRPYKGIEALVDAFQRAWPTEDGRPSLLIVGRAADPGYGEVVAGLARDVPGLTFSPRFLSDAELEGAIAASDLVVLPYTRMQNSGAALLALSVGRPVLVPDSPSMIELRDEVGDQWVRLFSPPFGPEALVDVAAGVSGSPGAIPDLSGRDWGRIGAAYSQLFRELAQAHRS